MHCPKCEGEKQRVIESRHTETQVFRRRVCKNCHHVFITQESLSELRVMPPEVTQYTDARRTKPKHPPTVREAVPQWDTSTLASIRW